MGHSIRWKLPPLTCKAWHPFFQPVDTQNFPQALHHIMSDFFSSQGLAHKNHLNAAVPPPIHTKGHWLKYHIQGFEGYRMGHRVPWGQDLERDAPCWEYSAGTLAVGDPQWSRNNTPKGPWSMEYTDWKEQETHEEEGEEAEKNHNHHNHHKPSQPPTKMGWERGIELKRSLGKGKERDFPQCSII